MALTPLETKLKDSLAITLTALTEIATAHIKLGNAQAIRVADKIMNLVEHEMKTLDAAKEKEKEPS